MNFDAVKRFFRPLSDEQVQELARKHAGTPGVEQSVYLDEVGLQGTAEHIERLRSLTQPMTNAQVEAGLVARFGTPGRENVSADDPDAVARADALVGNLTIGKSGPLKVATRAAALALKQQDMAAGRQEIPDIWHGSEHGGQPWDSFFQAGPSVSEDFMAEPTSPNVLKKQVL